MSPVCRHPAPTLLAPCEGLLAAAGWLLLLWGRSTAAQVSPVGDTAGCCGHPFLPSAAARLGPQVVGAYHHSRYLRGVPLEELSMLETPQEMARLVHCSREMQPSGHHIVCDGRSGCKQLHWLPLPTQGRFTAFLP